MELKGLNGETKKLTLDEILSGDDVFGVFSGVEARQPAITADDRLIQSFHEINAFYHQNTRWPQETADNMDEKRLARRLRGILENSEQRDALNDYDEYGILSGTDNDSGDEFSLEAEFVATEANSMAAISPELVTSLDDIFNSDSLGLLEVGDVDILRLDNVPAQGQGPYSDEEIGTRFECQDFWRFEAHFKKTHVALKSGTAEMHHLQTEQNLNVGDTFLLDGVLCYIADMFKTEERKSKRKNARLRLIFENGLESNMLMRSLSRAIYKDENGRQILFTDVQSIDDDFVGMFNPQGRELSTGHLYVLRLFEANEQLSEFKHLHKIGFTTTDIQSRIRDCENDIAFLESKVIPVLSFECRNMNPQAFENLIHTFFSAQRLNLTLIAKDGKPYKPKEWFDVSLDVIEAVANLIVSGEIVHYRMNNTTGELVRK
ncbi:MAG: GIY-YIG nuclease family protein [Alcaligenaceae bacterium]|nr:GIY-YIG nuclease family protein [Alcaligenaceae bacterium]